MTVMIRAFDPENTGDIAAVSAIYAYHVTHGTGSFEHDAPSEDEMRARFGLLTQKAYPILLAIEEGDIIGYAYAGPHKGRKGYDGTVEDSVYVAPSSLGKGVGRLLLSRLIADAKAQGYQQMMAVIGDSENHASLALHHALGFTLIGTAKGIGTKFGRTLDVTYMQIALQE